MTFKKFLVLLVVGVVILLGFIFILRPAIRSITRSVPSTAETFPPVIPRTVEIPVEIREKFASITEKPELIASLDHGSSLESVEFSPKDSSFIVSYSYIDYANEGIKVWDIDDSNQPISTLAGNSVSFSSDGQLLAICDVRGGVRLWDIDKQQFINTIDPYSRIGTFSPDGRWLATTSTKGAKLWDYRSPREVLEGPTLSSEGFLEFLSFSQNGKLLATATNINTNIEIWTIDEIDVTATEINIIAQKRYQWIEALEFSPDIEDPLLAIADNDKNIHLYYPPDWKNKSIIETAPTYDIAFTPDGKTLVSGGIREVEFWSVENGERLSSIEGYTPWIKVVDISHDGTLLACGGKDGIIRIFNIAQHLYTQQHTPSDVVKLIYFLPSDRIPRPDMPKKMDRMISNVQQYFADQMESHGFGRKTFTFEKNNDGSAKIYLFEGRSTEENYLKNPMRKVKKEIYERFDPSKNLYFILYEIDYDRIGENESTISAGPDLYTINYEKDLRRHRGGDIVMSAEKLGTSHMYISMLFGYAMGLNRNLRDASYLMSYGNLQKRISQSNAEWLNKSRLFNPEQTFFDAKPSIEKLLSLEGKVRFKVKDEDGIHQVRLLVIPTDENPPPGYQWYKDPEKNKSDWENRYKGKKLNLHDYKTMNGEKEAIVELDYPVFAKNLIEVKVIDEHGNMVYRELKLNEKKVNAFVNLIRQIF